MSATLTRPYTTVDRVKNECRLRLTETGNDDWIRDCIDDASRLIERKCGMLWETEYLAADPFRAQIEDIFENTVTLPLPIISMSGLYYGDDKDEIDSDDYDWRNVGHGALILLLDGVTDTYWYNQITNVNNPKIYFSGKLGYAVSSSDQQTPPVELPSEIVRAATITASAFTGMFQRESISYDGTRNTVTDTRIPEEAMTLLKPFTKLVL